MQDSFQGLLLYVPFKKNNTYLIPCPLKMFYSFVPQAVDQWIQHWNNQSLKQRRHFTIGNGVTGLGLHIHKYQSPIEHCDHSQVGPTGASFLCSLS